MTSVSHAPSGVPVGPARPAAAFHRRPAGSPVGPAQPLVPNIRPTATAGPKPAAQASHPSRAIPALRTSGSPSFGQDVSSVGTVHGAPSPPARRASGRPKKEPKVLFQTYFKSVGPRTYAAQVKEAGNGNQFLVLCEGKRDEKTGEVRKTRLFVFSEDFDAFWNLVRDAARFIKDHPLPEEFRKKRQAFWKKRAGNAAGFGRAIAACGRSSGDRRPAPAGGRAP